MFKFFTILFLIYYTIRLFKPSLFTTTANNFSKVVKEQESITDEKEKLSHVTSNATSIVSMLFLSILSVLIMVSEIIYIFSAVQYGDKLITIGFIIWWILLLIIGLISNKTKKANGTLFNNIKRFSLWRMFVHIIDVLYFAYMYFVLFLK